MKCEKDPPKKEDPPPTPKPETEKGFKKPVGWLLGPQLIASLKWIALYSAFHEKLDSKDWMRAEKVQFGTEYLEKDGAFWFDYIADTGDGQMATYSIAYLCMSDLWVKNNPAVDCHVDFTDKDHKFKLPRGAFLFVGGDTAYHAADYETLAVRFQNPFRWAFEDLERKNKISRKPEDRRHIFGIPGNHDYYDALDGFNRQFRKPATEEDEISRSRKRPQLSIPGFKRCQEASYVELKLPFSWWFWGLDVQEGKLDIRQGEFFRNTNGTTEPEELPGKSPKKLIVATPEPTTVFGKYQEPCSKLSKAFKRLGLQLPFLKLEEGKPLAKDKCRLDIAGDVHHYARYWGPCGESKELSPKSNYASVVSGLGGAFLHPSHTDMSEIKAQALYPSQSDSRAAVAGRIFGPWNVIRGGYVWLVGAIVAAVIYFACMVPPSTQAFRNALPGTSSDQPVDLSRSLASVWNVIFHKPFGHSLLVLLCLILSVFFIVKGFRHREKIFKRASQHEIKMQDYWPVWALTILGVAVLCVGVGAFGRHPAAHLFSDLIFASVVIVVAAGLPWLAYKVGAESHGGWGKVGFGVLGSWHALLQLAVPFLIVMSGSWVALGLALLVAFAFIFVGAWLAKKKAAWPLLLFWLTHGCLQLVLPVIFWVAPPQNFSWPLLGIALGLGAVMSCVWLGWYLAVSLAYNGHNNEAGGAARIENFKQFIRFRITNEELTGYVIAIDKPQKDGCSLRPKIVDIFRIAPSG